MHFADFARADTILSRSCENGGKFCGGDGDDTAGAAFVEEGKFGGSVFVQRYARPKPRVGETRFGQCDSNAAIGNVVGGLHRAVGGEGDQTID